LTPNADASKVRMIGETSRFIKVPPLTTTPPLPVKKRQPQTGVRVESSSWGIRFLDTHLLNGNI
jgi:hypothetical protein